MITEIEQQSLDIDWFFTDGKHVAFVASGGGKLPKSIAESSDYNLLSSYFRNLPEKSEIEINVSLSEILKMVPDERYLADYVLMTKKGLYSFDKTILNNFLDPNYHLVAQPISPLEIIDLPKEVFEILIKSKYDKNLTSISSFNSFEIT
ncbi:hypothetical protein [Flavobacterium piscisymbiosum]|uniref:Uncharacterized protein n=1 Tax=Flavobacterium piscisymbiosum TaxID=2893753 RepID=A0ABS8MJC7_9FLAO|nr:hypothetical protein [Flavobacterium sp. F-30]MCC9065588.1 hypothetical protein [Flavobacterium sp. F-30]